jgi:hypothetical protein
MADPTSTDTVVVAAQSGQPADSAASSPEVAPTIKVTRAKATTSDVPRRRARASAARSAAADSAGTVETTGPAPAHEPASITTLDSTARPASVEIFQGGADSVAGDSVSITQGGASVVNARSVEIHQGGIANAHADDITVRLGGVALARAERLSVEMGGVGVALAREAQLTQGMARTVIAQDVRVDQGLIGTAFAGKVTFEKQAGVFLLLAGKTEGPVKALMDWRGALAFGAAFGLLVGLLRRR